MIIQGGEAVSIIAQLRTTDLDATIDFYVEQLGFVLDFRYEDFYAGIRAGEQVFHLKLIDDPDPSIGFVAAGDHFHLYFSVDDVDDMAQRIVEQGTDLLKVIHDTPWGTREFAVADDQGHILYFGQGNS